MLQAYIVEDDPMVASIHQKYLAQYEDIRVAKVFANGRDAWEAVEKQAPDLMILDIYMPFLSGLELLQRMRAKGVHSDVILVTAANDMAMVDKAMQFGVIDYLIKPFERRRFCEAVEKFMVKRDLLTAEDTVVSQTIIDRLMKPDAAANPTEGCELRKGLSRHTLDYIQNFLATNGTATHTCASISEEVGLSQVTVRRYLNYLTETGFAESTVDYETGGRPSVRYAKK